jgi:hypothetical protein
MSRRVIGGIILRILRRDLHRMESAEFTCKCGDMKTWLSEGVRSGPCPICGRDYVGYYDRKRLSILGREVRRGFIRRLIKRIITWSHRS